ncbi:MAG: M14 family zinc carboxypeptidase [Chitinophagales bacterium]
MKKLFVISFLFSYQPVFSQPLTTIFEETKGTQSPTYHEIIDWWRKLDQQSPYVKMLTMGMTDAGFPLNLIVVSNDGDYNFESIHKKNKRVILINNGIHPGEPDGIDACMLLARDINDFFTNEVRKKGGRSRHNSNDYHLPENIVLAIIPVYNIGGCLNRSANYRIDQNGPLEKGFRGNSQNLDLNRDFIKCDSREARAFTEIFHLTDPDVFVDNHVSDGADYQHIITLLASQHDKLGGIMGEYMNKEFEPALYSLMKEKGYDLVPYVNSFDETPENGWPQYWDSPRYSSGFATLWRSFAFVPETHMLKSYEQRVRATYTLMQCFIEFTSKNTDKIKQLRDQTKQSAKTQTEFPISWELDRSQWKEITYKGYEAGRKISGVSGLPVLFYDRSRPFERQVKLFNYYHPTTFIKKPIAYIIPQGWWKVIDLLKLNKVEMRELKKDSSIEVEVYHIDDYKTAQRQYEMHHLNTKVKISTAKQKIDFKKGDWYIPMNQTANRFLIETLEPQAEDSYFAWNFFDTILGQKEGFSDYVFEDIASDYLKNHPDVKNKLDQRRSTDTVFAKNAEAQLNFVYQNSPYFEPDYLRYPVYRVID